MADFARVLAALDSVTGWSTLERFQRGVIAVLAEAVDADQVAMAIRELMTDRDEWIGTATQLLEEITPDKLPAKWPATPAALGGRLRRAEPSLSLVGISVEHDRQSRSRDIVIRGEANPPSPPSSRHEMTASDSNDNEINTPNA